MAIIAKELARRGRQFRKPQHRFNLKTMPYTIQPFLLAPVLPGETMNNLLLQARAVTDPIKNPLIGWWLEYYFFYVKHRDLEQIDGFDGQFQSMMLDPSWSVDAVDEPAASVPYYHAGAGINWSKLCLQRVVEEYFRDTSEAWTSAVDADGLPRAMINNEGWWQSIVLGQSMTEADDVDVDLNADDTITAGEVDQAMRQWMLLRENNLIDMSYEDYLQTFGVRVPRAELHIPELLRFVKEWQYPSNTVDPTDGSVASAVSWAIAERADKARFFREPGFIFGVTVSRPKVYMRGLLGSAAGQMTTMINWLPAILRGDHNVSWKEQDAGVLAPDVGEGMVDGEPPTDDTWWWDVRDLLLYGDQFINYDLASVTDNLVTLPEPSAQRRYAATADIQAMFAGANYNIRQDGVVSLAIASAESKDLSPQTPNVMISPPA